MVPKITGQARVHFITVEHEHAGRRLDNFLITHLKSVPRCRIYRMVRTGEVRVNKGRIKQSYRLQSGDKIRIPPVYLVCQKANLPIPEYLSKLVKNSIIYEDEHLLALNKPANIAVHGGSGIGHSIIGILREQRPEAEFLELAHRLDRGTSGCLLIAKDHKTLRTVHDLLKTGAVKKRYLALLKGTLQTPTRQVNVPLGRKSMKGSSRGAVRVSQTGKQALTYFHLVKSYPKASLVRVIVATGRTHQIRVHAQHIQHPIAGDDQYGDWQFNREIYKIGLKRLFLHAEALTLKMSKVSEPIHLVAPLPAALNRVLEVLKKHDLVFKEN